MTVAAEQTAQATSSRDDIVRIAVAAVFFRFIGMIVSQRSLPVMASDTVTFYLPMATSIAHGNGFTIGGSAAEAAHLAPLYPVWLSLFVRMGVATPFWIGLGNVVLRALSCVLVYVLGKRYFGRAATLIAVAIYILDPWEAFWVGYVLKESFTIPLFLLALIFVARAAERPTASRFLAAGVATGIGALARFPTGALWAVTLVIAAQAARRCDGRRLKRFAGWSGAATLGFLIALAPWVIRNWRVIGQPVLSTHFMGRTFYTSNGPGIAEVRSGYYSPKVDNRLINSFDTTGHQPVQQEAELAKLTLRHLVTHPEELPARLGSKVVNMWQPTFADSSTRNWIVLGLPYCILLLLSLVGLVFARRRGLRAGPITVTLVVFFLMHLVYWGEIRNRQYLMPLLYCFGGYAVATAMASSKSIAARPAFVDE